MSVETIMHSYLMSAFVALLFVVLTPGVLLTVPPKGSKIIVAAVIHGIIFAIIYHFTHGTVSAWSRKYEGFTAATPLKSRLPVQGFENPPKELKKIAESLGFNLTSK